MDQLKLIFTSLDEKADIIIMTETWCDESQAKTLNLGFKGYETLWSKTKYNQNGGIGIAIRNGISYSEKDSRTYKFEADALIIEIKGKTEENNYLIVALYRNPSRDINKFINDFETFLSHENKRKGKMVIIGDMNININKNDIHSVNLTDLTESNGFIQTIEEDTRTGIESSSRIDLCFTNAHDRKIITGVIHMAITDHNMIHIALCDKETGKQKKDRKKEERKRGEKNKINYNYKIIEKKIEQENWSAITKNCFSPNEQMSTFQNKLSKIIQGSTICKNTTNHYNKKCEPWINKEIMRQIRKRDKLLYKRNSTTDTKKRAELTKELQEKTKTIKKDVTEIKNEYYKTKLKEANNNNKNSWNIIKEITEETDRRSEKDKKIEKIKSGNEITTDEKKIANIMNQRFIELSTPKSTSLDEAGRDITVNPHTMFVNPIEQRELITIINNMPMNKLPGSDGIGMNVIKNSKYTLAPILTEILNNCISEGIYPDCLKKSIITLVYKKGDRTNPENYRPISNLCSIAKILEKALNNKIENFLTSSNLLSKKQYAHRKGYSTLDAQLELTEEIETAMDNSELMGVVLIDIKKKAYDSVNHTILKNK